MENDQRDQSECKYQNEPMLLKLAQPKSCCFWTSDFCIFSCWYTISIWTNSKHFILDVCITRHFLAPTLYFCLLSLFFFLTALCNILVPWPGIEPGPGQWKQSPNHRTARWFPACPVHSIILAAQATVLHHLYSVLSTQWLTQKPGVNFKKSLWINLKVYIQNPSLFSHFQCNTLV